MSCLAMKGFLPGIFKQKHKVTVSASEIVGAWQFGAYDFLSYGVFFLVTV
jgi:hypothetical protein